MMVNTSSIKLVLWDWLGTLISADYLLDYYLKQEPEALGTHDFNSYKTKMLKNNWVGYIPYAWQLVEKFHDAGLKQVIVTNASRKELELQLEGAPFKDFDQLLTVSEFNPKPDTQMFEYALASLGYKPEEALFIGDSETDQVAANALDMPFEHVDASMMSYFRVAQQFNFVL